MRITGSPENQEGMETPVCFSEPSAASRSSIHGRRCWAERKQEVGFGQSSRADLSHPDWVTQAMPSKG